MLTSYVGAVAVSWYRNCHTLDVINILLCSKIKTNIHYVLANNTIAEAIEHLKNHTFPNDINAVIFLLHKPVGSGGEENVLQHEDKRVKNFFR